MALVEGVQYGLSSQANLSGKKSVIFVKLTDSALRAIEEYVRIQNKTGQHATLQFLGNEGRIHIPSSHANDGHSFDFSLSSNADIEGPQGSFECIQQCGARSLESMGTLPFKMRVHAKDDVYEMTRERMTAVEEERKKDCAKEIKQNGADISRKMKKSFGRGHPTAHRREDSPIFNNHNSNSHHSSKPSLPNSSSISNNHKISNGPPPSNNNANSKNSPNGSFKIANKGSNNLDVSRRPLKERLIHLLAVKPFKKPELWNRLMRDTLSEKDKKLVSLTLQQVSIFKDNEYNLIRGIWNDVQEDWPFYTEQERQLMKRRKPQNLTPPGSDCSVGSGTSGSSLSPRSTTSVGSDHSPVNYGPPSANSGSNYRVERESGSRVSHYSTGSQPHPPKSLNGNGSSMPGLQVPGTHNNGTSVGGVKRPGSSNGGVIADPSSVVNGGGLNGDYGDIPATKKCRVSNFKPPSCRSGVNGSSSHQNGHNGNGPSANARLDSPVKSESRDRERDSASLSPVVTPASSINSLTTHQSQHHRNYSERLSPIGTNHHSSNLSANHSQLTNNQTSGQAHSVVTNHRSPRSVVTELTLSSPYHNSSSSNHSSGHNGGSSQDDYPAYPWPGRNGHTPGVSNPPSGPTHSNLQNHHHSHDNGFKLDVDTKLPDSDETDSVDSGNGSSSSSSSSGSTSHIHHLSNHSISNTNSANSVNGLPSLPKVDSVSGGGGLLNVNGSGGTNGCNRVSSTTTGSGFQTTPQSSPDSQIDGLHKQPMEQQQKGDWTNGHTNNGYSTNGGGSAPHHNNVNGHGERGERDRDNAKDKYRDREQERERDRPRGEGRREGRVKDRDRSDREFRGDKDRTDRDRKERDREREKCKETDEIERQVKSASEYPSYLTKYTTIQNGEQRSRYKEDFNAEYGEYRNLHSVIDKVSKKFAHLEERLRQEERGTEGYQNVKDQIVSEYYANKKNRKYQDSKSKFTYLHEKLSHIKKRVLEYDALHSSESNELEDGTFF